MSAKKATKAKTKAKPRAKKTSSKVTASNVRTARRESKLIERKGVSIWDASSMFATVFSVGRIPYMPGTWGSLVGVVYFPLFLLIPIYVNRNTHQAMLVGIVSIGILTLLYCIGVLAIKVYQNRTKTHDGPEIVYDEFFGQILTYSIITAVIVYMSIYQGRRFEITDRLHSIIYQYVPFFFFRLFDIWKPYPIKNVDQQEHSAWGVMFDDVLAAFYAAAASIVVFMALENYI